MTTPKRPLTLGDIAVISTLLVIVAVIGFPFLSTCTYRPTPKNRVMSQLKQISTALMIYADESDGHLPATYTPTSFQTALAPYTRDPKMFQAVEKVSTTPTFNYNLAGLNLNADIVPLGHAEPIEPSKLPMVYALLLDPKLNSPAVVSYADGSTKAWPAKKPFDPVEIFGHQFPQPQQTK